MNKPEKKNEKKTWLSSKKKWRRNRTTQEKKTKTKNHNVIMFQNMKNKNLETK